MEKEYLRERQDQKERQNKVKRHDYREREITGRQRLKEQNKGPREKQRT